jgi:hypothetical protein
MLTIDLLDGLRARWERLGAPVAAALRPGLDESGIDRLTEPPGIRLPAEARLWWMWHDGATSRPGLEPELIGSGGAYSFFPLARAVEQTLEIRESLAGETWLPDRHAEPNDWQASWLLLTEPEEPIVLDCSGDPHAPVPVRRYSYEEGTRNRPPMGSIGELVAAWCEAIDAGACYDRATGLCCLRSAGGQD